MKQRQTFLKVFWVDALHYKKPLPRPVLPQKLTTGLLVRKLPRSIVLRDPKTLEFDAKLKLYYPDVDSERQTFLCIPKGMIERSEKDTEPAISTASFAPAKK